MQIDQIELYQSRIKLREPFIISLGPLEWAEHIVVIIRTTDGLKGYGECSPFMTINGETVDTCYVVGQLLAKVLLGKDPLRLEECALLMDKLIWGNSSIKSAFSIALYDIAAQEAGLPLWAFLGGKKDKTLFTDYTVSLSSTKKMAADALWIKEQGYGVVKVKLGGRGEEDIERICAIRDAIGNELPLRIDANQGWSAETAIATLKALAPCNIQHCEEPIPRWDFMNLPTVRAQSPVPIMADESCCDHHDAARLIQLQACDSLNIKLGKSSGFLNAQKIVALADEKETPMQVGGFLESRLGFTASAHLALSSKNIIHFDFDTPLMQTEDPVVGGISYGRGGEVQVPDTPGLGAGIDEEFLKGKPCITIK
ncbi:mandelate racemase/muconate lactonizing enzyme family protein [Cesiribacter sp. SM1]|uniref:mandelate racemase/muconate lactonizing enzyme family protein n=1 Tax=Cesiribacter sp. SM1 TaxID=2861196 RepID=UPI001CD799E8|nr:dipeptide epimerase [Cesiribacter sp. SM1]